MTFMQMQVNQFSWREGASRLCFIIFFTMVLSLLAFVSISKADRHCNKCHSNTLEHQHKIGARISNKTKGFGPIKALYKKGAYSINERFSCKSCHTKTTQIEQIGSCTAGDYDYLRSGEILDRDSRNNMDWMGVQIRLLCNGCHQNIGESLTANQISLFTARK